ncbi:MAG TPA: hypothetical protein VI231_17115 [Candidatus Binatia bacterium]|jgi:hypothetical protein
MKAEQTEIEGTINQLMKAASEIAFERCDDTAEAYALRSMVLIEMIRRRFSPAWQRGELFGAVDNEAVFN